MTMQVSPKNSNHVRNQALLPNSINPYVKSKLKTIEIDYQKSEYCPS